MKNPTYKTTEGTKTLVQFSPYITSPINKTLKLNTSETLYSVRICFENSRQTILYIANKTSEDRKVNLKKKFCAIWLVSFQHNSNNTKSGSCALANNLSGPKVKAKQCFL